jgi:hypothetical protein
MRVSQVLDNDDEYDHVHLLFGEKDVSVSIRDRMFKRAILVVL